MIDAVKAHPVAKRDLPLTAIIQDIGQYMPQLMKATADFGADFVDAPQPVHSFDLKWQAPDPL